MIEFLAGAFLGIIFGYFLRDLTCIQGEFKVIDQEEDGAVESYINIRLPTNKPITNSSTIILHRSKSHE